MTDLVAGALVKFLETLALGKQPSFFIYSLAREMLIVYTNSKGINQSINQSSDLIFEAAIVGFIVSIHFPFLDDDKTELASIETRG